MTHALALTSTILLAVLSAWPEGPTMKAADASPTLTRENASAFAKLALKGAKKQYPNKPGHVLLDDADAKTPRALHPAFYGCYDWHSAVHGHWMLVRLLKQFPDLPEAKDSRAVLNEHLTAANIQAEVDYFTRKEEKSFERPYGWAWLLKLAEELHGWDDADAKKWSEAVKPLAEADRGALRRVLPEADLPDPHRRAFEHRVRPGLRARLRPRRRRQEAARADRGARERTTARTPTRRHAGSRTARTSSRRACAKRT